METTTELYDIVKEHEPGLDWEDFKMISENGADWGVMGFTYYADTISFYDKNERIIEDYLIECAEEYGVNNMFELPKLGRLAVESMTDFKNWSSWFILEEVANAYSDDSSPCHGGTGGAPEAIK